MTLSQNLAIASAFFSLFGGVSLAFALGRLIAALELSIGALEVSVHGLAHNEDVILFTGTDKHRLRGGRRAVFLTYVGIVLLILSAIAALGAAWTA